MAYELPKLNFGYNELAPHIDAQTMEIHHTKHHQAYIDKTNAAISGTSWEGKPIEDLLRGINDIEESKRSAVRNNGGGHANHSLFWQTLSPKGGGEPVGKLAEAITRDLGGFAEFQEKFSTAAATRFGSGWAWLSVDNGNLVVSSTANQDSPYMTGSTPILGLDVWEHAYYLNYQNRRPAYISAFFSVVDWNVVEKLYEAAV